MEVIKQWLDRNLEEFIDSTGGIQTIDIIETVQKTFNTTPKYAERIVEQFLEERGLA